jgi:hypothetical protein
MTIIVLGEFLQDYFNIIDFSGGKYQSFLLGL